MQFVSRLFQGVRSVDLVENALGDSLSPAMDALISRFDVGMFYLGFVAKQKIFFRVSRQSARN